MKHGVYVEHRATDTGTPIVARVSIPFVIGAAPVHSAADPAPIGLPVLCETWDQAVERFGYSDNWKNYNLCEFMYAHFKVYGRQPVIFCNVLDTSIIESVTAADIAVADRKALLPIEAVNDEFLEVKSGSGDAYIKGTDYGVYYAGGHLAVELLRDGNAYNAASLNVSYNQILPSSVTPETVAAGMQNIEKCMSTAGVVPDLICAPGYSSDSTVAAVMAVKAAGVNGLFRAKALVDIDAATPEGAMAAKEASLLNDANQIVCWPMLKFGGRDYHLSTQLAGLMARVDGNNGDCPYESPSNKPLSCNAIVTPGGDEVTLTHGQANALNAKGIVTALNFMGGFVLWGNYAACYPGDKEIALIPVSRMFDWVGNTLIRTFWGMLDMPMNRRLVDSVMDTCNIWLNGLTGAGYLLGARVEFLEEENPVEDLRAGIIRVHIYMTPPSPAQEINFILQYDASYVASAFS